MKPVVDPRCAGARAIRRVFKAVPGLAECLTPYADISRNFSVRVPCFAEYLVRPNTREQVIALWRALQEEGVGTRILGGGTNTIPVSPFLQGVTLSLERLSGIERFPETPDVMWVWGGTPLQALCKEAERSSLAGLAGLAGVPGSVAGALVMNAGGRHGNIGMVVESVEVLEPDGKVNQLSRQQAGFEYRKSALTGRLVLGARLRLPAGDAEALKAKRLEVARQKREAQPLGARSAGCYFQNLPDGRSTGLLIQQAGLKGTAIGGAMSSLHHGNFFVNQGEATGADFVALAERVRRRMRTEHGIELTEEVKLWR